MTEPFILFTVAGTTYGLRSTQVAHVELIDHVTPVPNAAHFVDGVVFSRGEVVPALNLRARFGFERAPLGLSSRLLVATAGGWSSTRRANSSPSTPRRSSRRRRCSAA
jgi:purine-binding chemotaxis protein CheW